MLVKYYGLVFNESDKTWLPRSEFLENGLFRITQPLFLNDKGSESKFFPYYNEFSPADLAWARKKHDKFEVDKSYIPSQDDLEKMFLVPTGVRYGDAFPHLVNQQTGFNNINEFDQYNFEETVKNINNLIVQALSCKLGVLSLSKSDVNEHMWTHYASEGKGIAITFNKNHPFFKTHSAREISYKPEKRASFTYYKGSMRINGEPIKNFILESNHKTFTASIFFELLSKGIDLQNLAVCLLFSKAENWILEDETRIVFDLNLSDEMKEEIIHPNIPESIKINFPHLFNNYHKICLKNIPFDAFDSLVFGYSIDSNTRETLIDMVKANRKLSHLKIKNVSHNIFGKLETNQVTV